MHILPRMTGLCALALIAGCTGATPEANVAGNVEAIDNAEIVVPEAPGAGENIANAVETVDGPMVNLAPDGLSLVLPSGSARHIPFDTPRDQAVQMVTAAVGKPIGSGTNPDCGGGALDNVDFKDGLRMYFQSGKFQGWSLDAPGGHYSTAAGIGIGSTRNQLEDVMATTVEDSTIGHEFTSGDLSGLLSSTAPEGRITNLWAGASCIFR